MKPVFRPIFIADIEEAGDYLWTEAGTDVAENFRVALEHTLALICDFPELGRLRSDLPIDGIRTFHMKDFPNWLVFYRLTEERLEFLRIKHGMMHLPGLFESEQAG